MAVSNVWSCPLPALFAGPVEPSKAHHYMAYVKATCQQKLSLITKVLVEAVVIWLLDSVRQRSWGQCGGKVALMCLITTSKAGYTH